MPRCFVFSQLLFACLIVVSSLPRSEVVDPSRRPGSTLSIRQREGLGNSTRGGGQGGIVFPTDNPLSDRSKTSEPQCVGNICENVPDYPQTLLENMLVDYATEYRALFGNDLVEEDDVKHRIGAPLEIPLCESRVHVIYPQKAQDKDGKLRYVVNTEEHKQGVRIETCVSEGSPCQFSQVFPMAYKVTCRQRHVFRKLVALNENKLEPSLFALPSCCMCIVESNEPPALETRANRPLSQTPKQDNFPKVDNTSTRIANPTNTSVKSYSYGEDPPRS